MTLLGDFYGKNGEPLGMRVPTPVIVANGGSLTDSQFHNIRQVYAEFSTAVRLSPATFHTKEIKLSDDTVIRMESNNGVDRVMVWPTGGGIEEDGPTFYGIPYDETYIDALVGYPGELAKEAVFFVDKMRIGNGASAESILNRLKLANQHRMYPSLDEELKRKPSQPGNMNWFEKGKKRTPILSWWGPYSRYSNSPTQYAKWGYKVWGRSLLVNNVFWESEATAGLQKYPPIYNADRVYGGDHTFANPVTGLANANDVRDYLWISGMRVKTGAYDELGLYILSACIGNGSSGKVVRLTLGFVYPTTIAEIGLAVFSQAARDGRDLDFATDFLTYTIAPNLPEALGIPTHENWINWQIQPPFWNSGGSEAMGIVDHYTIAGNSNITHSLYKLEFDADTNTFSAALVEQSAAVESWTNTTETAVTGSLTTGTFFPQIGSKTVSDSLNFSSSIVSSKVIAADYDGNAPVIVRMEYEETMTKEETLSRSQTGSESTSSGVALHINASCTPHGTVVNYLYMTTPGIKSGARSFSREYANMQRIFQSSTLKAGNKILLERSREYTNDVSCSVSLEGTGNGAISVSTIAYTEATAVDHGGGSEAATGIDREVATYTYDYVETHSRNLTFTETSTGSCTDFSIVGDLRNGVFVVQEQCIQPGMFSTGTPGDAMTVGLGIGESWGSIREGSASMTLNDSATVSYTDTSANSNNASITGWTSIHDISGTWSHSANGSMDYGIPEYDGMVSLVSGDEVSSLDTASLKGTRGAIERRRSFTSYTPFTSSYAGTADGGASPTPNYGDANGSIFGQTTCSAPHWFSGIVIPSECTYGYTYDNSSVSDAVFYPPSTNSQPEKINPFWSDLASDSSSGPTTTSGGGSSTFRFGSNGFNSSNGAGGYPYYSVASSAADKSGRIVYIGYQTETLIKHDAPNTPYVVKLDLWIVNGHVVVPSKEYPHTGVYKMFSCPVFV